MKKVLFVIFAFAIFLWASDLKITPGKYSIDFSKYDFIDTTLNVIQFPKGDSSFTEFYNKMDTLVFENKGKVRILHIGGSHIQADVSSGRIREHLIKEYPGASAGRGFIFPYSAARTNTPSSYASYYKGIWSMSKNVLREVKKPLGLLGIAVSTEDPRAEITLMLDKYNGEPIWEETKFRLFGYSDNGDVVPVLKIDSMDIYGELDSLSQSFVFNAPRAIDTIQIQFRWLDSLHQASIAKFITDSLVQDSIAKALADSLKDSLLVVTKDTLSIAQIPKNVLQLQKDLPALDSMYQGECDVLDSLCLLKEEQKDVSNVLADSGVNVADSVLTDSSIVDSLQLKKRPHFTLTGILSENEFPGIIYTNVGINGAKVSSYFENICPLFERELSYLKPDLVIFAIGINDANVEHFDEKNFRMNYDTLITRIKKVNPNVAFIFETNNDMFRKVKKRRFVEHPSGVLAQKAFFKLAEKYGAGVWDKFSIMGGLGSMAKWEKVDLAKKDKVHFKMAGYHLLGDMFYKALIQAYQNHIANLPALPQDINAENLSTDTQDSVHILEKNSDSLTKKINTP